MRHLVIGATLALCSASATALAQAPSGHAGDPAYLAAKKQFEEGKRLFREGKAENDRTKLESAYFDFKAAYAIFPSSGSLWNLVMSEVATARMVDAMGHLRAYQKQFGEPVGDDSIVFKSEWNAAFSATGHLAVEAEPGARLEIDGNDVGTAPLGGPIDVSPGTHAVSVHGQTTRQQDVNAEAGKTTAVRLAGEPPAPFTRPPRAVAPSVQNSPPPPAEPAEPFWDARTITATTLAALAIVSVGIGTGFAVQAGNDSDRIATASASIPSNSSCFAGAAVPGCADLAAARASHSDDVAMETRFLVGAGVFAALAIGTFVLWPHGGRSAPRSAIVPTVNGRGGAGAQWWVSF